MNLLELEKAYKINIVIRDNSLFISDEKNTMKFALPAKVKRSFIKRAIKKFQKGGKR